MDIPTVNHNLGKDYYHLIDFIRVSISSCNSLGGLIILLVHYGDCCLKFYKKKMYILHMYIFYIYLWFTLWKLFWWFWLNCAVLLSWCCYLGLVCVSTNEMFLFGSRNKMCTVWKPLQATAYDFMHTNTSASNPVCCTIF